MTFPDALSLLQFTSMVGSSFRRQDPLCLDPAMPVAPQQVASNKRSATRLGLGVRVEVLPCKVPSYPKNTMTDWMNRGEPGV